MEHSVSTVCSHTPVRPGLSGLYSPPTQTGWKPSTRSDWQHQIAKIRWQDHVWNTEVSSLTGLGPVLDPIIRRRSSSSQTSRGHTSPVHQATYICWHVQAALGTCGLTNSTGTTVHLLLTSGDATVLDDYALTTNNIHKDDDFYFLL